MTKSSQLRIWAVVLLLLATCLGIAGICPVDLSGAVVQPAEVEAVGSPTATPERILQGIVVDEADRPVPGATVRPVRGDEQALESATTADDGTFSLALGGSILIVQNLIASAQGDALLGLGTHVEPQHSRPAEPVRIVLKPGRTVSVHVQDSDGQPVADAAVEAVGFGYQGGATTDANGEATLRIPADAAVPWIIALKPGVGFDYFENYRRRDATDVGPPPDEVVLTLDGALTVQIRAIDTEGAPVPNVEFRTPFITKPGKLDDALIGGAKSVRSRTNGQGIATFEWLPVEFELDIRFLLSSGSTYSCPESLNYRFGSDDWNLKAHLLRNTSISGVVRDENGEPAAGVLLQAEGRGAMNRYCRTHTRTGEDGSYRLEVFPNQSYIIAVLDDDRAAKSVSGIHVREGQPHEGLDLTLVEGTIVQGRVTIGPDETPVPDRRIGLNEQGTQLPEEFLGGTVQLLRSTTTDAEGRYRFRVGPGRYELWGPNFGNRVELRIEDEKEIVHDFRVDRFGSVR